MNVTVTHGGESIVVDESRWQEAAEALVQKHGPWDPATSKVEKQRSDFGGDLVVDESAKARIEHQGAVLAEHGITVDRSRQFYDTATRMADIGYQNQQARAVEHAGQERLIDAAHALIRRVQSEQREDTVVSCGDLLDVLHMNGKLTVQGFALQPNAIRGLLTRIESPATRYIFGIRDRIREDLTLAHKLRDAGSWDQDTPRPKDWAERAERLEGRVKPDKQEILDVMTHELRRSSDVKVKLRLRHGLKDCFSIVSPTYGVADAPLVVPEVIEGFPADTKGSFSYDPTTTSWEMRASVFTPTPVDEQAVGEAFRGFASYQSRDDGNGGLGNGGGIEILACLNAGTFLVDVAGGYRIHRPGILDSLAQWAQEALGAIHALIDAWGVAREDRIPLPKITVQEQPKLIPIEEAIPGFYRHMLTARRGELVGVLPGQTKQHAKALSVAYFDQRRDKDAIVRADLAQGWTRYIQDQPTPVRRDAEAAIGAWMVKREPVRFAEA